VRPLTGLGGVGSEELASKRRKAIVLRQKTCLRKNFLFSRKNFPVLVQKLAVP
jgi:hypothetical protein